MRKLSDTENRQIITSITGKVISSAEILMEIYDHYVSHLKEVPEEKFNEQLTELDKKFTYSYCHDIEFKFNQNVKEDISKTQWKVIKKYFCTSRCIYLVGFLALVFFVSTQAQSEREVRLLLLSPFILLLVLMSLALGYQWIRRILPIKKLFKENGVPINSSFAMPFSMHLYIPIMLLNVPKLFFDNYYLESISPAVVTIITVLFILYAISLMEVLKIKSKTVLI